MINGNLKLAKDNVTAIILAGGAGQRMQGKDKGLLPVRTEMVIEAGLVSTLTENAAADSENVGRAGVGRVEVASSFVSHLADQLKPQVYATIISANRNLAIYRTLALSVVSDRNILENNSHQHASASASANEQYLGPLAGVFAAGETAVTDWLITVPVDSPDPPAEYVKHMSAIALSQSLSNKDSMKLFVAHDGTRPQHAHMLLHKSLLPTVASFLEAGGRSLFAWQKQHGAQTVMFEQCAANFDNVNTQSQLSDWLSKRKAD